MFASGLLSLFMAIILYTHFNNLDLNCGCFIFLKERKMSFGLAIQDGLLLLIAIYLYKIERTKQVESPKFLTTAKDQDDRVSKKNAHSV